MRKVIWILPCIILSACSLSSSSTQTQNSSVIAGAPASQLSPSPAVLSSKHMEMSTFTVTPQPTQSATPSAAVGAPPDTGADCNGVITADCPCLDNDVGIECVPSPSGGGGDGCSGGTSPVGVCNGKPVIYLYPTKETTVSVQLKIPGTIFESIPNYPSNGWQGIDAFPNGHFVYQGKPYTELFYESLTKPKIQTTSGIVLSSDNLPAELQALTGKLGLLPNEQREFLSWWVPRLAALHAPYIEASVLTPEEKKIVDEVDISPIPDTFIDFLVYFKPITSPLDISLPQILPQPPSRHGFTAVEWGGAIIRP